MTDATIPTPVTPPRPRRGPANRPEPFFQPTTPERPPLRNRAAYADGRPLSPPTPE